MYLDVTLGSEIVHFSWKDPGHEEDEGGTVCKIAIVKMESWIDQCSDVTYS